MKNIKKHCFYPLFPLGFDPPTLISRAIPETFQKRAFFDYPKNEQKMTFGPPNFRHLNLDMWARQGKPYELAKTLKKAK
jgi:hypothetical protein